MSTVTKITDLKQDDRNANKGSDRGRAAVQRSIEKHGTGRSVLLDRNGRLIAGNKTQEGAIAAGVEDVIIVQSDGTKLVAVQRMDLDLDTDKEARELAYADNRTNELGYVLDVDVLSEDLAAGIDVTPFYDEDELRRHLASVGDVELPTSEDAPEVSLDRGAELRQKWGTETGQLWQIGGHRLLCGSSTNPEDVQRLMGDERAKLFQTDPPYLVNYTGMARPGSHRETGKDWTESYHDWDGDEQGADFYRDFMRCAINHAITDDAPWYCWHASVRQAMLQGIWEEFGVLFHQQIIWVKDRGTLTFSWYLWQHEPCLMGWVKGKKPRKLSQHMPGTLWHAPYPVNPGDETLHPTSKPIELFAIPMEQHTIAGEICYEPFSGSGSQHVAGEKFGRRVYGVEKCAEYVAVILERLSLLNLSPQLLS